MLSTVAQVTLAIKVQPTYCRDALPNKWPMGQMHRVCHRWGPWSAQLGKQDGG